MKNKFLTLFLAVIMSAFAVLPAFADTSGNQVGIKFSNVYAYSTRADSIENVPLTMGNDYFIDLVNEPDDTNGPLSNPKVVLNTSAKLDRLWPEDPSILSRDPASGIYTWTNRLEMAQGLSRAFTAHPADGFITARPGFSMSRAVYPETLSEGTTIQTVTVSLKLEEALPLGINRVFMIIGNTEQVYQNDLVASRAVGQQNVEDWRCEGTDNGSARWSGDPSVIQLGKTYTFTASIESTKSPELSGKPVYKPFVVVILSNTQDLEPVASNSITLTNPVLASNVTFSADNEVVWRPQIEVSRYDTSMSSYASEITPYPYHVVVPASVVIEPRTLNLDNRGNGVFTAFIKLPAPYRTGDILADTIKCQNASAIRCSIEGDTLMAKFYRKDLIGLSGNSEAALEVTGSLNDGSFFKGSSIVRVK